MCSSSLEPTQPRVFTVARTPTESRLAHRGLPPHCICHEFKACQILACCWLILAACIESMSRKNWNFTDRLSTPQSCLQGLQSTLDFHLLHTQCSMALNQDILRPGLLLGDPGRDVKTQAWLYSPQPIYSKESVILCDFAKA